MRRSIIYRGLILLAIGFVGLASARANPPGDQEDQQIVLLSHPYGIASGQSVSISVVVYASRPARRNEPASARIQLLGTEGEVIAESDEIRVEPGKTRSWDVPRETLPATEPTGRVQVRTRILVTTKAGSSPPPLAALAELFDTTRTIWLKLKLRQVFPEK
jgi:hypothetical protein